MTDFLNFLLDIVEWMFDFLFAADLFGTGISLGSVLLGFCLVCLTIRVFFGGGGRSG